MDREEEEFETEPAPQRRTFSDWMKLLVWASMGTFSLMAVYQLTSGQSLTELGWDKVMMTLNAVGLIALALHYITCRS